MRFVDYLIIGLLLSAVLTAKASVRPQSNCYATCHQFESALLVGCYLSDFEGRYEKDITLRKKNFARHEDFCRALVKELMGADSGCGQKER